MRVGQEEMIVSVNFCSVDAQLIVGKAEDQDLVTFLQVMHVR